MRGALGAIAILVTHIRVIPADAGSTVLIVGVVVTLGDHPRRCGEHIGNFHFVHITEGSSPQMRGAHWPKHTFHTVGRIIPADAGSTCYSSLLVCRPMDHPRRCGEHHVKIIEHLYQTGSSPQMRGALRLAHILMDCPGIIPADAGSTYYPFSI